MKQSCKTCKFAQFQLTDKGNIKRKVSGKCNYEIAIPKLPSAVTKSALNNNVFHKSAIWPDEGTECPTYEKKE